MRSLFRSGFRPRALVRSGSIKFCHVAFEVHFDVHTDPVVEESSGTVDVDVREAGFDDFGDLFAGFLVVGDPDGGFALVARIDALRDCLGEGEQALLREFEEAVGFVGVAVD